MAKYIDKELALSHPFANGHYDHKNANEEFILGHESYKEWLEDLPTADVIVKTEYDKLLAAAKAMHTWIFLNTVDEFEVYDECGLTDEMNALLGSMGRFELKQEKDDE